MDDPFVHSHSLKYRKCKLQGERSSFHLERGELDIKLRSACEVSAGQIWRQRKSRARTALLCIHLQTSSNVSVQGLQS